MIEDHLKELSDTWGYTTEELDHIRELMATYALEALLDSSVAHEAEQICQDLEEFIS